MYHGVPTCPNVAFLRSTGRLVLPGWFGRRTTILLVRIPRRGTRKLRESTGSYWPYMCRSFQLAWGQACSATRSSPCRASFLRHFFRFGLSSSLASFYVQLLYNFFFLLCIVWFRVINARASSPTRKPRTEAESEKNFLVVVFTLLVKSFPRQCNEEKKTHHHNVLWGLGGAKG